MISQPYNGWNSFDAYSWSVTEAEMHANADILDKDFKPFGYQYVVLDFIWSMSGDDPNSNPMQDAEMNPRLHMDVYGRLLPAPDRFPSSLPGNTLRPLADYVHGKGLKMGLHLMRGIPRQAVLLKTPIKGTDKTAADIALTDSKCNWLNHMYGIDMQKEGAQEYLDSLFALYAEWEIDFVKVDDIAFPYRKEEIEGYRKAIEHCGRDMVLSLSPGPAPLDQVQHLAKYADMWRISADFWDEWEALDQVYGLFCHWSERKEDCAPGFPDGDMIPFSKLSLHGPMGYPRYSRFTHDEKQFLMSLWCLNNSPLMLGGDLTVIDEDAKAILTNPAVLGVQRFAKHVKRYPVPLAADTELWVAGDTSNPLIRYCGVFNRSESMAVIDLPLEEICGSANCILEDLWSGARIHAHGTHRSAIRPHAALLYMIIPE